MVKTWNMSWNLMGFMIERNHIFGRRKNNIWTQIPTEHLRLFLLCTTFPVVYVHMLEVEPKSRNKFWTNCASEFKSPAEVCECCKSALCICVLQILESLESQKFQRQVGLIKFFSSPKNHSNHPIQRSLYSCLVKHKVLTLLPRRTVDEIVCIR